MTKCKQLSDGHLRRERCPCPSWELLFSNPPASTRGWNAGGKQAQGPPSPTPKSYPTRGLWHCRLPPPWPLRAPSLVALTVTQGCWPLWGFLHPQGPEPSRATGSESLLPPWRWSRVYGTKFETEFTGRGLSGRRLSAVGRFFCSLDHLGDGFWSDAF